ncbi:MAG: FG-GAP-like repeat-containing protein [Bacteroidia bacterium]|nr:FG-GAP-like repeat-containing protein [Bacteroidia bacterium]
MKKQLIRLNIFFLFNFFFFAVIAQPTITSFFPASGPIGTVVIITGANFNTSPTNNIVFFGATKAIVNTATTTSLNVTVPIGANYKYISVTDLTTGLTSYSAKPFIVTFTSTCGGGGINTSAFDSKIDFARGNSYGDASVALSDLNGDGKPDLVVINQNNNTFSVLKNTSTSGIISFAQHVDFATGNNPNSLAIGDLDGDGKPDLVATNSGDNTFSILRNTSTIGIISFASKIDYVSGSSPWCVSLGDIDGDGKTDLAIVNNSSNSMAIIRNTSTSGIISFDPKVDFTTGSGPLSLAIGDLDGDGKPDLAVTNQGSNTVSVLKNTSVSGTFAFASKADFATANSTASIAISDLDGDGKPDLAVANYDSVFVLINASISGTISFAANVGFATGSNSGSLAIGDLNGDGKPEIAVSGTNINNVVHVLENTSANGATNFDLNIDYATGSYPIGVSICDLDGDGRADLEVGNAWDYTVSVFRNKAFAEPPAICMVTVDSASINNIIYWDKTLYSNVDSFIVYRETISNSYKKIGAVQRDSLSMLIDTVRHLYFPFTGDPNTGTYRYKLQIRDTCGNYSLLSSYHNTIYVTQTGGTFNWNNYQIESEANPIPELTSYNLYRDNNGNGNWSLVSAVSGSQLTINDPDYTSYPNARWRIETVWSISCTPTRALNNSRSNIKGNMITNGIPSSNELSILVSIYPNPFLANTTIGYRLNKKSDVSLEIYNALGQKVETLVKADQTVGEYKYNFSAKEKGYGTGVYFLKISLDGKVSVKRIVELQ